MKKLITVIILASLMFTVACGKSKDTTSSNDKTTIAVATVNGFTSHKVLEIVKPLLAKEGITLDIKPFQDFILPNTELKDKNIDANFFQTDSYLNEYNAKNSAGLVEVTSVLTLPTGAYSKKYKSTDELPDGASISIPNDPASSGRSLQLLAANGLIKLKDGLGLNATTKDITENKKNFKIVEVEQQMLTKTIDDVDLVVLLGGYQTHIGLHNKDALFLEDIALSPKSILVAREDNKDSKAIQQLAKLLRSPEVKDFIEKEYQGDVLALF